jgi:ribosome-associated toxin RatA of RatAB toxin-antitoxin module
LAKVAKTALVPYSAQAMYDLVNDINAYQDFLPWCSASEVVSDEGAEVCGRIEIAKAGLHQSFTTCNWLTPPERIELHLKEGPFRHLQGEWYFQTLREDACKVHLTIDFEFSNKLIEAAFGPLFRQITDTMVDAFCKRAAEVYQ